VMSMESPKYRWRSAAHFGQKRIKCSAVLSANATVWTGWRRDVANECLTRSRGTH